MRETLRIKFVDFWKGFDSKDNYFTNILGTKWKIEISEKPDILVHSVFGIEHLNYNCVRVEYTSENTRADFRKDDYCIGFDLDQDPDKYLRWPIFLYDFPIETIVAGEISPRTSKSRFCNFVYSNDSAKERIEFFHELSKYKRVDSAGRVLNNMGTRIGYENRVANKMEFIKDYKFTIAFENSSYPGYTTEKLIEPLLAGSIPIYWGNPRVGEEFNSKRFINVHDFKSYEEVVAFVEFVDNNEKEYNEILSSSFFRDKESAKVFERKYLISFFEQIHKNIGRHDSQRYKFDGLRYYRLNYFQLVNRAMNSIKRKVGF